MNLPQEEFLRRTQSRFNISIFLTAQEETLELTNQTTKIEQDIDQRVADLYGVKL